MFALDGTDFISKVYSVTFDNTGFEETVSTVEPIFILDDKISEATESFTCVIFRPHGVDGIVVEDPNTISFAILDDDGMYTPLDFVQVQVYMVTFKSSILLLKFYEILISW